MPAADRAPRRVRPSSLLMLAGSLLILAGVLVVLGVVLAPPQAPRPAVTIDLSGLLTPTPGYLGTPLAPPASSQDSAGIVLLPEMPVASPTPTAAVTRPPSRTPAYTVTPTASQTPTTTPAAAAHPTDRQTPDASPAVPPTAEPSRTLTSTPTFPPTFTTAFTTTFSPTPPPTATATQTTTPAPTDTPTGTATLPPSTTPVPDAPQRIIIPALEVNAGVQPVGMVVETVGGQAVGLWDVPGGGMVGWHENSARPGDTGNIVLNGHHNIEGRVFGSLVDLVPGDAIYLWAGDAIFRYTVAQTMVLQEQGSTLAQRQQNARWIQPGTDSRLTLVTCWPQTNNTHRLIVVAVPAEAPAAIPAGIPGTGEQIGE